MTEGDLFDTTRAEPESEPNPEHGAAPRRPATSVPDVVDRAGLRRPFDLTRLRESLERAVRAAAAESHSPPDLEAAHGVVDIVRFSLANRAHVTGGVVATRPVAIDDLGRLVERALVQVGAVDAARAYIVARDRRHRSGGAVTTSDGGGEESAPGLPLVVGRDGSAPFERRRIVAALIQEADLVPEEAEDVAEGAERALMDARLRIVSSGLVRELVGAELLARGRGEARRRQETIGVPRHDLRLLFEHARSSVVGRSDGAARSFETLAARELLSRHELEDVFSSGVAEAHRAGDLDVIGLGRLHLALARSVPASLLMPRDRARSHAGSLDAIGVEVARLARETSGGVWLDDAATLAGDELDDGRLDAFLSTLGAIGAASAGEVALVSSGGESEGPAIAALVASIERLHERGVPGPRLYLDWPSVLAASSTGDGAELGASVPVARRLESALAGGRVAPIWGPEDARWAGPACRRRPSERGALACGAAIALNLPRLARRAGPWREEVFLESLEGLVRLAAGGLEEVASYQRAARRAQGEPLSERVTFGLVPVGLFDALRILGDGLARARVGARVLGFLHDAASRVSDVSGIELRLTPMFGALAAQRFAFADARERGPGQPRLFPDLPRPEEERPSAYRHGWGDLVATDDVDRVGRRAEALGALLATTRAGVLAPDDAPVGSGERRARTPEPEAVPVAYERALVEEISRGRPRVAAWARFDEIHSETSEVDLGSLHGSLGPTLF